MYLSGPHAIERGATGQALAKRPDQLAVLPFAHGASAWTADEVTVATETLPRIRAKNAGPQTQAELSRVEAVVKTATRK
jgi:hypothetical protein